MLLITNPSTGYFTYISPSQVASVDYGPQGNGGFYIIITFVSGAKLEIRQPLNVVAAMAALQLSTTVPAPANAVVAGKPAGGP